MILLVLFLVVLAAIYYSMGGNRPNTNYNGYNQAQRFPNRQTYASPVKMNTQVRGSNIAGNTALNPQQPYGRYQTSNANQSSSIYQDANSQLQRPAVGDRSQCKFVFYNLVLGNSGIRP